MKIKTLIVAAALATASTAAVADVMTPTGELVMVEKNQASLALGALSGTALLAIAFGVIITAAESSGGS